MWPTMSKQELRNINLVYYFAVNKTDCNQDVEILIAEAQLASDWNYSIPFLLIEDEKEF